MKRESRVLMPSVVAEDSSFERRTSQEFAMNTLRRQILSGALTGGTRLIQTEIANELGISTTPVREALRELAAEGLVTFDAHYGAAVISVNPEEAREILWIRSMLEPEAMRLTAENRTQEELDQAKALETLMSKETDQQEWSVLNRRFHTTLIRASHSPRLGQMVEKLRSASSIYVYESLRKSPEPMVLGNQQHSDLIRAIAQRDGDRAASITTDHIRALQIALDLKEKPHKEGKQTDGNL